MVGEEVGYFVGLRDVGFRQQGDDVGGSAAYAVVASQELLGGVAQVAGFQQLTDEAVGEQLDEVAVVVAPGAVLVVEGEELAYQRVNHAVAVGVAHGDVDAVFLRCVGQRVEGGDEEALIGQHDGGALSLLGVEPFRVPGQQLAGVFALQDVLGAVDDGDALLADAEERRARGAQLGEVAHVLVEEEAGLLVGFEEVDVVVAQQVPHAAAHELADDAFLAARQGVEAHEIDSLVGGAVGQVADMFGHLAVGHAAVGFALGEELLVQTGVVLVEGAVEVEVLYLEFAQVVALDVPLADGLEVVQVVEDEAGVNEILVNFREVAHHQVAKGDEVLERLVFAFCTTELHMDVVQLEKQELVRHNLQLAQLRDELVDGHHLRQEAGASQGGKLLGEEAFRAVIVEDHQHLVGVFGVLGDDA